MDNPSQSMWVELQGLPFKQTYYNANGVRTRVIEAGKGEPLLLLHGTAGHAEAYIRNIRSHAEHFRVLSVDMVGHGYSDQPEELEYFPQDFARHLKDLVDALGAERAHVSGESLGSHVAAWYAILFPDRIGKLVLNTGMMVTPSDAARAEIADVLERARKVTGQAPTYEAMKRRMDWLMHKPERDVTEELVMSRLLIYEDPKRAKILSKIGEQVLGSSVDLEKERKWRHPDRLKDIKAETLVLWTRYNPGMTAEEAKVGADMIPNAKFVVLEDSAHWPQWEEKEAFNKVHLDFLLGRM